MVNIALVLQLLQVLKFLMVSFKTKFTSFTCRIKKSALGHDGIRCTFTKDSFL